jgi:hypothetical protein
VALCVERQHSDGMRGLLPTRALPWRPGASHYLVCCSNATPPPSNCLLISRVGSQLHCAAPIVGSSGPRPRGAKVTTVGVLGHRSPMASARSAATVNSEYPQVRLPRESTIGAVTDRLTARCLGAIDEHEALRWHRRQGARGEGYAPAGTPCTVE